jgi:hypothetical protein
LFVNKIFLKDLFLGNFENKIDERMIFFLSSKLSVSAWFLKIHTCAHRTLLRRWLREGSVVVVEAALGEAQAGAGIKIRLRREGRIHLPPWPSRAAQPSQHRPPRRLLPPQILSLPIRLGQEGEATSVRLVVERKLLASSQKSACRRSLLPSK